MMIFARRKLVLLALPKTGTTALEAALGPLADIHMRGAPALKHTTLRRYRRFIRPYLATAGIEGLETACLLREPTAWLRSWHAYRRRPALDGKPKSAAGLSFAEFVDAYLSDPQPVFAQVGVPSRFVAGPDGSPGVDHLFRYEDQGAFQAFLEDRLERKIDLPRRNVSPPADAEPLPPALQARLERERAADFALYRSLGRPRSEPASASRSSAKLRARAAR
ncbi:MAG: gamma-glutamyl kinase [Pseudomonadota bacterium]